jgi:hypothetical protein
MSTISQIYGDLFVATPMYVDIEDARRHRENIEAMRQFEPPPVTRYYEAGSGRFGPAKLKRLKESRSHIPLSGYHARNRK